MFLDVYLVVEVVCVLWIRLFHQPWRLEVLQEQCVAALEVCGPEMSRIFSEFFLCVCDRKCEKCGGGLVHILRVFFSQQSRIPGRSVSIKMCTHLELSISA